MAGLFGLIWATALGISATKHAVMNSWCKNNSRFKLPNGIEYYCDADGKYRLLNGTQIMWWSYGEREKVIEVKTNKVVYDRGAEIDRQRIVEGNISKKKSINNNNLLYIKRNPRCSSLVFFETKTDKQLAEIVKITYRDTEEVEYRKLYFYDYLKESLPPGTDLKYGGKISYWVTKQGDDGVVITEEEFNQIKEESRKLRLSEEGYQRSGMLKISNKYSYKNEMEC